MLLYNFYIFRRAGYTLRHCIPWVDRPSSISGASLGLSGGRSSLRIPGIFSPDMSWSMGTSDTSLRSEMDNTFRLDRMESDRLIATRKKKRNLIAKKKTRWKKHLLVCDVVFVVCDVVFVVCDCPMDDSYTPAPLTPGVAIVARAIPVEWWNSPLETAATDGADGLSLHEPEVTLRLCPCWQFSLPHCYSAGKRGWIAEGDDTSHGRKPWSQRGACRPLIAAPTGSRGRTDWQSLDKQELW